MISTLLVVAAAAPAAVALRRRARRARLARAAASDTSTPFRDSGAAAPVRVLLAPAGLAVALPQYVTTPDGDVRACWGWNDTPGSCEPASLRDRAA